MTRSLLNALLVLALGGLFACGGGGGGSSQPAPPVSTAPTISGISPAHGSAGSTVAITGTNLSGISAVTFNGHPAFSFTATASQIDAVVPGDATSGSIGVTGVFGSAASPTFTVDAALAPSLSGFSPALVSAGSVVTLTGTHLVGTSQVQFNGVNAAAFTVLSDTQIRATAPAGLTAGTLAVTTPGGTATSSMAYAVGSAVQVLMNADFEAAGPLIWQGDTGVIQPAPGATAPSVVPHGGTQFAWLGGYASAKSDLLTQDLYIPATAQAATLSFFVKILTSETGSTATDTFTVTALSPSNAVLGTLLTKSNLDAADYKAYTVDLLPHKGQVLRLAFKSQEDAQTATSFLLDDVQVNLVVPNPSDLKPNIMTFTPTSGIAGEVSVDITGENFFGLTAVTLGGASASFVLTDGTRLTAALPATATTGSAPITMTNAQGTGTSATNFAVALGVPTILGINPSAGPVGTPVVLTGTYLGYTGTTVTINGTPVTLTGQTPSQLSFTVPAGATSGALVLSTSGGTANGSFTVNAASTTLDLHVDYIQLTQSTQTLDNAVPIVAGKDGLVRVFVLANQSSNTATPSVEVTLLNGGVPLAGYPKIIPAPGPSVPTAVDVTTLAASWNLVIPGTDLTTPAGGQYTVEAVVDPGHTIAEADETNNQTTTVFSGTTVPIFKTTIFPVVLSGGTGDISAANQAQWVARLAKMYPVASVDVAVGPAFTGSVATLASDGTGWDTLLNDLTAKHLADGASDRYYYGALNVSYSSGVAGLGWVPSASSYPFKYRTAIGWDKTGYSDGGNFPEVFAHETGHNMGRNHSPCGGAGNPDPAYPYADGLIGMWGYDSVLNQLYSPVTTRDIMGYCKPNWVSDYVYQKILAFRGGTGGFLTVPAEDAPLPKSQTVARECLIVRGIVREGGRVDLLPAFRTQALPSDIPSTAEYTLDCLDEQGRSLLKANLDLMELGSWPKGHDRHFVMALSMEPAALDALASLKVAKGREGVTKATALPLAARLVAPAPEIRRLRQGQVELNWDATLHPAALVRDADTKEVLAILAGGRQTFAAKATRFEVVLSDGVRSLKHQLGPVE
jgi:hypothetical protein